MRGGGGVFDVTLDGKLLFSKHKQGRFPEPGEILSVLRDERGRRSSANAPQRTGAGGACATDCCSSDSESS